MAQQALFIPASVQAPGQCPCALRRPVQDNPWHYPRSALSLESPLPQRSCGHGPALLGTDLRASQEPLGPSLSPGFFLEPSESWAVRKSASCLPRVKRSTILLPSPSHCPLPLKQYTSWLKASGRERLQGITQPCWPAQVAVGCLHIRPRPLLLLLSQSTGVGGDSGEIPTCLACGCLPMRNRGFSLSASLPILAVCEEHMEKLHLGGFYGWGRQGTREGKQPVTPELRVPRVSMLMKGG